MRKLHVLKGLVDFLFITSSMFIPFILIGIPTIFFMSESGNFKIFSLDFNSGTTVLSKVFVALFMMVYLLIYISIYKFRSLLTEFKRSNIFTNFVIKTLKEIGILLLISGLLLFVSRIGFNLTSSSKVTFDLGISSHYLCVCFGLFFLVLSEIFNVSKNMKQENDLTI